MSDFKEPLAIEFTVVGGVPANVAAQIRSAAEEHWGTDYEMVNWQIKNETEAWLKLNGGGQ